MVKHKSSEACQSNEPFGLMLSAGAQESCNELLLAESPNLLDILDWNVLFEVLSVSLAEPVGVVEGQPMKKDVLHVI